MNLAGVDLNLLVAFDALMEERSVTRAAARVGLTQSAMSNALARLRVVLEDPLFKKKSKEMVPTARASQLAGPVRSSLAQLKAALTEPLGFDATNSTRTFTISTTDYVEFLLVGSLLRDVTSEGPAIQINAKRPDQLFLLPEEELRDGSIDAAIGFFPNPIVPRADIRMQTLFEEQNVCIARSGHPGIRKAFGLEEFVRAGHVGIFYRPEGPGLIDTSIAALQSRRKLSAISRHFLAVPFIVAQSDLIAVVPERIAKAFKRFVPLRVFNLPFDLPVFTVRLVWLARNQDEPGHVWLRKMILRATLKAIGGSSVSFARAAARAAS